MTYYLLTAIVQRGQAQRAADKIARELHVEVRILDASAGACRVAWPRFASDDVLVIVQRGLRHRVTADARQQRVRHVMLDRLSQSVVARLAH